jgi:hypothetical protein
MEVQQIRLNINELVNNIQDEALLSACYQAVEGIANAKSRVNTRSNGLVLKKKNRIKTSSRRKGSAILELTEKPIQHDLSLVLLSNNIFKNSMPSPNEAIIAFNDALLETALRIPTLPNRL